MRLRHQGKHHRRLRTVILRRAAAPGLAAFLAAGLVLTGAANATAATAAPANPVSPKPGPSYAESYSPYLPQVSCDPTVKPGTAALRATLLAAYGGRDLGVTRGCDTGAQSEHKEGRAFDWGLSVNKPAEKAIATQFLTWLMAPGPGGSGYNARRLGVMYVIWDGKIWGAYRAGDGWRKYTGGEAHADHIHISLSWNGAMKRTSWWTGKRAPTDYGPCPSIEGEMAATYAGPRATPCPAPIPVASLTGTPVLRVGSTGPYVRQLQQILHVTPVSGTFATLTDAALRTFQKQNGLSVTGTTNAATWTALRGGGVVAPPAVPDKPAASISPKYLTRLNHKVTKGQSLASIAAYWRSSVSAIKAANHLKSNTVRPGQVISVPVKSWLTRYSHTTVHKGSHNPTVKALQTALRMPKKYRTGMFGDITKGYVNRYKHKYHWKQNGVVGPPVWRKLGA